ncbi:MAG: sulfite exporter TauE/SafE family protein [Cyanobacteria bacterium P01_H01_bin.58]
MAELLLTALILFGASLIAATFGFGNALFAMPLLTLFLGLSIATPLSGLVGITIAITVVMRSWQRVDIASAWRLIVATWVGIPIGVLLVKHVPDQVITQALGAVLIGFGIYRLANSRIWQLSSPTWAFPFGFVAGILGGAYNTNGPPVLIYGELRHWSPTQFRATLQSYFFPTGVGIVATHGLAGLWNTQIFVLYGVSLPGILLAIAIGSWLNAHLPVKRFQALLSGLLIGLGVLLWL